MERETHSLTAEDFQRTQQKVINAFEAGHGVTLAPGEVERLVMMLQGMELVLSQARGDKEQAEHILAAVLYAEGGEDHIYRLAGELYESAQEAVAGWDVTWDEESNVIQFQLIFNPTDAEAQPEQPEESEAA